MVQAVNRPLDGVRVLYLSRALSGPRRGVPRAGEDSAAEILREWTAGPPAAASP